MPEMDGVELLGKLKELNRQLPVILATSFSDVGSAIAAMRAGAEDYLTKPIDLNALKIAIERVLERREASLRGRELAPSAARADRGGAHGLIGPARRCRRSIEWRTRWRPPRRPC